MSHISNQPAASESPNTLVQDAPAEPWAQLLSREKPDLEDAGHSGRHISAILERMTDGFVALDSHWRFTYVNAAAEGIAARLYRRKNWLGKNLWEEMPGLVDSSLHYELHRAVSGQVPISLELYHQALNVWFEVRAYPDSSGLSVFFRDITEIKRDQEALRFQAIVLESMQEGVNITDNDGTILFTNPAFDAMFGYSRGELRGQHVSVLNDLPPEENRSTVEQVVAHVRENGVWSGEFCNRRKDGTRFTSQARISILNIPNKEYWVAVQQDVTERKRAERRQAAFSALGQQLNSATTPEAAGEIIVEAADALVGWDACSFATYSSTENVIRCVLIRDIINGQRTSVPPWPPCAPPRRIERAIRLGRQLILRDPAMGLSPDGMPFGDTTRPSASIMIVPIRKADLVLGVLSIHSYRLNAYSEEDIETLQALADHCGGALERIRTEEALRQSELNFRELTEVIPHMVWTSGPDGHFQFCNRHWHNYTGQAEEESGGSGWLEALHPDHRKRVFKAWRHSLETGEIFEAEYLLRRGADGAYRWHTDRALPVRDAEGNVIKWFGTCTDIHEKKCAEEMALQIHQELERRVAERTLALREVNDQMESFCYSVSHDLRAPLRAMRAFAQVLLDEYSPRLDEVGRDYLERVSKASERMDRLIQDLLEYSRLGRMQLQVEPIDLSTLIDTVLMELRMDIRAAEASMQVARPIPPVMGNEIVLEQILTNLISNSLKFVAPDIKPIIQISAERRNGVVRLAIRDNGIGIRPEHHKRIFGVFERLHSAEAYPGTGIGLAIVEKGVRRLNGSLGIESAAGKGTYFWIELAAPQENCGPMNLLPENSSPGPT